MDTRLAIIIDDEPDVATYLAIVLRDNGWEALTANSADEGLRLAEERVPDVVFLDIMMPERGGMSTLVALAEAPGARPCSGDFRDRHPEPPHRGFRGLSRPVQALPCGRLPREAGQAGTVPRNPRRVCSHRQPELISTRSTAKPEAYSIAIEAPKSFRCLRVVGKTSARQPQHVTPR